MVAFVCLSYISSFAIEPRSEIGLFAQLAVGTQLPQLLRSPASLSIAGHNVQSSFGLQLISL